jgi:hypothetical protein
MSLTLCPRVEDGWVHDYLEDLTLTPTPRDEVDWSLIPDEVINLILRFVDLANIHYWSDITAQKTHWCGGGVISAKEASIVEYHMNKRLTLKTLGHHQSIRPYEVGRNPYAGLTIETWDSIGRPGEFGEWTQEQSDDPANFFSGQQVSSMMKSLKKHAPTKPFKVKVIKKKNKKEQSKRVCSLCGKVGHNKNNRKFH